MENRRDRRNLLIVAWVSAGGAMLPVGFMAPLLVPLFPYGILHRVFGYVGKPGFWSCVGVWAVYGVLTILTLFANSRLKFWSLYGLLVLMLVLNVSGCYAVLDGMGNGQD